MGRWKQHGRADKPFAGAYRVLEAQARSKKQIKDAQEAREIRRAKEKEAHAAERRRIIQEREDAIKAEELARHLAEAAPHGFIDVEKAEVEAAVDCNDFRYDQRRRDHRASQQLR